MHCRCLASDADDGPVTGDNHSALAHALWQDILTLYKDTPGLTILRKLHQNLEVSCQVLENWVGSYCGVRLSCGSLGQRSRVVPIAMPIQEVKSYLSMSQSQHSLYLISLKLHLTNDYSGSRDGQQGPHHSRPSLG